MPIEEVMPNRGSSGTDVMIVGLGFNNATGVTFGGIGSAFFTEDDTHIRATVPPNAIAGRVVVLDPDGNQESPTDFDVVQSSVPQNTTRGRAALDTITLLLAAAARQDWDGASRFLLPVVWTKKFEDDAIVTAKPSTLDGAGALAAYNAILTQLLPASDFIFQEMQLVNDAVQIKFQAENRDGNNFSYVTTLRNSNVGYRVAQIYQLQEI